MNGRELFILIYVQGAWRFLRLKISHEWFRLFIFTYTMIHIGKKIEEIFYLQGRSPSWLAAQLCCDRTNIYSIFKRESIDTALLARISSLLNHDFFQYYQEDLHKQNTNL